MQHQLADQRPPERGADARRSLEEEAPSDRVLDGVLLLRSICNRDSGAEQNAELSKAVGNLCSERLSPSEATVIITFLASVGLSGTFNGRLQVVKQSIREVLTAYLGGERSASERVNGASIEKLLRAVTEEARHIQNPWLSQMVLDALEHQWVPLSPAEVRIVSRAVGKVYFATCHSPEDFSPVAAAPSRDAMQLSRQMALVEDLFEITGPLERRYGQSYSSGLGLSKQFAACWLSALNHERLEQIPHHLRLDHPQTAYLVRFLFYNFCRGLKEAKRVSQNEQMFLPTAKYEEEVAARAFRPTYYLACAFFSGVNRAVQDETGLLSVASQVYNLALKGYFAGEIERAQNALESLFATVRSNLPIHVPFQTQYVSGIPIGEGHATLEWSEMVFRRGVRNDSIPVLGMTFDQPNLNRSVSLKMWDEEMYDRARIMVRVDAVIDGRSIPFGAFELGCLHEKLLEGPIGIPTDTVRVGADRGATILGPRQGGMSIPMTPKEFSALLRLLVQVKEASCYVTKHYPREMAFEA